MLTTTTQDPQDAELIANYDEVRRARDWSWETMADDVATRDPRLAAQLRAQAADGRRDEAPAERRAEAPDETAAPPPEKPAKPAKKAAPAKKTAASA